MTEPQKRSRRYKPQYLNVSGVGDKLINLYDTNRAIQDTYRSDLRGRSQGREYQYPIDLMDKKCRNMLNHPCYPRGGSKVYTILPPFICHATARFRLLAAREFRPDLRWVIQYSEEHATVRSGNLVFDPHFEAVGITASDCLSRSAGNVAGVDDYWAGVYVMAADRREYFMSRDVSDDVIDAAWQCKP